MTSIAKQIVLLAVFFSALGSVFVLRAFMPHGETLDRETAMARYGFYLEEVSKKSGIDFTHKAPQLDPKLKHIMPIVAAMGASVSVVDFDKDGWPDLFVVNSGANSKNRLYRNMKDGTFKDVAAELGLADLNKPGDGACMGAVWGDFFNDGYEGVLVYRWGKPVLFRNVPDDKGGRTFKDVTASANLPKWVNAGSAIW